MDRQQRHDRMTIGEFERFYGLPAGCIRAHSGRDVRSDKTIGALRRDMLRKPRRKPPKPSGS